MWTRRAEVIAREAGYVYVASADPVGRKPRLRLLNQSGLVTLSRYPIVEREMLTFSRSCGLERFVSKGVLFTRILRTPTRCVDIYNLHMISLPEGTARYFAQDEETNNVRAHQLAELEGWIRVRRRKGIPAVVLGDFNVDEREQNGQYRDLNASGLDLYRARYPWHVPARVRSIVTPYQRAGYTFHPLQNKYAAGKTATAVRLDHIRVSRPEAKSCAVKVDLHFNAPPWSDHYGVSADILWLG
jgi:endonuclease/exonuclease/phosphatase family metal-dependent hydrolase